MARDGRSTGPAGPVPEAQAAYCPACGHLEYPASTVGGDTGVCGVCGSGERRRIDPPGTVYTFTVVYAGAPGVATPYALAYVDFEPGARAFGRIELGDAEIGAHVVPVLTADGLSFERCREDRDR